MKKNFETVKQIIEEKFDFNVNQIKYVGSGVDSDAYLVNDTYIFKIGISENSKEDYEGAKKFSDFYVENKVSNIEIPVIEYFFCTDQLQIVGYKMVKGIFADKSVYDRMDLDKKEKFAYDVATFLKRLHRFKEEDLDFKEQNMKEKMLDEVKLIKKNIYDSLTDNEKRYIDVFNERVSESIVFDDRKCLCHKDFNPDHILVDENMNFKGVIDWGDASLACEYAEFAYLLSDGDDEYGREFGLKVLDFYKDIDVSKAIEYSNIHKMEYPLTELVYGIENNRLDRIQFGKEIIAKKCEFDEDIINIMKYKSFK